MRLSAEKDGLRERQWQTLVSWSLIAFALNSINLYSRRLVPLPEPGSWGAIFVALAYLALLLLALMGIARSAAHVGQSPGFVLTVGVLLAAPFALSFVLGRQGLPLPLWLVLSSNSLFLPAASALVGAALGRRFLRHPNTLLAGAGFAVFFDIVVVTMGTVAVLLQRAPQTIAAASVGGGAPTHPLARPLPPPLSLVTIGPADVLFLGIFLGGIVQLKLSERATLGTVFAALLLALAWVQITGLPVPALAPMGAAVLLANFRHAAFTRAEKIALVYGGALALVLAVIMVAGARAWIR